MRLLIILTFWVSAGLGQNPKPTKDCDKSIDSLTNREIYNNVDTQAKVVGGLSELYSEISTLRIPKDPDIDQIKITISFIIETNGDITGLRIINKIQSATLDNQVLQLLKKYKWEPGTCKGVKVPTRLLLRLVS
jgi:hypothetical protein